MRGGNYFISLVAPECVERQLQHRRPIDQRHSMAASGDDGKFLLEFASLVARLIVNFSGSQDTSHSLQFVGGKVRPSGKSVLDRSIFLICSGDCHFACP